MRKLIVLVAVALAMAWAAADVVAGGKAAVQQRQAAIEAAI